VEATLPQDLVPAYSRLVAVRGEDAMALVEDRNCTSCYTSITAQQYNDLTQGMFVV
jgi:predicted  nucleic acid-binding Zn-ribbon protein